MHDRSPWHVPRVLVEFCAAVFDLQLQPVVRAGARESLSQDRVRSPDGAKRNPGFGPPLPPSRISLRSIRATKRDPPHTACREIVPETDWNRAKSNPATLGT